MLNNISSSKLHRIHTAIFPKNLHQRIMPGCIVLSLLLMLFIINGCMDYTRKTKNFEAPKNCDCRTAYVKIEHKSGKIRGSHMGPGYESSYNIHTLVLEKEKVFNIELGGGDPSPGDYSIVFSPDCHVLALSQDKGKRFRFVFLNTDHPFICSHIILEAPGADLWKKAPSAREVVLQILNSSTVSSHTRGLNHTSGHYNKMHFRNAYGPELLGALSYAVKNAEDKELRTALINFMALPGEQVNLQKDYLLKEIPALLDKYDDLKKLATKKLGERNPGLIAMMLAVHQDAGFQKLIAEELGRIYSSKETDDNCDRIFNLTAALAVKTAYLKNAGPDAIQALSDILENPKCPLLVKADAKSGFYKEAWSIRGEKARIYALNGLAASGDEKALAKIRSAARDGCFSYQRTTKGQSDTVQKNPYSGIYGVSLSPDKILYADVGTHNHYDISCYAQALLDLLK